jgi:hypothetical protein
MNTDCTKLSLEELHMLLHNENFKFSQGLENGFTFEKLKEIRFQIKFITSEIDKRSAKRY